MNKNHLAYIALGSNLNDPLLQVQTAIKELQQHPDFKLEKVSSLYQTKPVGMINQPDFINAVVAISTNLNPEELLKILLELEQQHQRIRKERWGPRTLDLDILLYDDLTLTEPGLTLPHPRLTERAFVLKPLAEIAPDLCLPDGRKLQDLVSYSLSHSIVCTLASGVFVGEG